MKRSALPAARRIGRLCAFVCACAGCVQTPVQTPVAPPKPAVPAPAPPAVESISPQPKLRGIKPAGLPREEPGVGVGGLTH